MNQSWPFATRRRFIQAVGTLIGFSLAQVAPASTATEKKIYSVSPQGNNTNPGTFEKQIFLLIL
jgi:hypothetical protein